MCFRVKDLLEWEQLKDVTVLAGEDWLHNEIKGVTIIEAPDIVRFINGGEVLLTGLYAFKTCSLEELGKNIQELEKKRISALIFKRGRDVELAEEKIAMFCDYAIRNKVPMIEVPFEVYFKDVMQEIMERLFNEEVRRLKYFKTTRDNFEALILCADEREDGVEKILHLLETLLDRPVGVFEEDGTCIFATEGMEVWDADEERMPFYPELSSNYRYGKQKITVDGHCDFAYVIELQKVFGRTSDLVVLEKKHPLDVMDFIAMESACGALQYELSKRYRMEELERKYQNDLFYDLVTGKYVSDEEAKKYSILLGLDLEERYRVIVVDLEYVKGQEPRQMTEKMKDIALLKDALKKEFPDSYLLMDLDKVIVIPIEGKVPSNAKMRQAIEQRISKGKERLCKEGRIGALRVGVGKSVEGVLSLKRSYQEALDALQFLHIEEAAFEEKETKVMMFSDLGILKLLTERKTKESLLELIPEVLLKLYYYKKPQRDDLMNTLRVYLDRNQNLMKAAQDLHVHYKTVAYRIEKIEDITGMDFDHPGEMLAVRIGFIACKMLDHLEGHSE